ncbi:MAG TPA: chloride channel protein [Ktedonobacterales bacterium]|nr:chloride channel protein [Ktedonobacterales bacterium]
MAQESFQESFNVREGIAGGLGGVRGDVSRRGDVRQIIVFSLAAIPMGVIGAVCAWALYHLINIFTGLAFYGKLMLQTPVYPPAHGLGIKALIIPVVGALLVGVMARYGTDRIRGHGIPEAMEAVLAKESRINLKVAIFKPISAAIAVGSGGPFGAEGPIIQTGGAIGSLIGQAFHLTSHERRILLACGAAAGMVGIFNTPMAAVALALELLLFEFRARSLVPVIIASAVAAGCRTVLLGSAVMFHVTVPVTLGSAANLFWLVPLGIMVGVVAVIMSKSLNWIEEYFDRLPVTLLVKPAMGAVVLGLVAMVEPRVLGMGYTVITSILDGAYSNPTVALLAIGKAVALVFSLGAGTSGGLLAPMLLIGAGMGVGYGRALNSFIPGLGLSPSMCGIVAMSGLFASAARAPLTSFLFAFELTGNVHAIVPLMIGCMAADVTARALSRESVMTERLVRRGLRISQDLEINHLAALSVRAVMSAPVAALSASMPLGDALRLLAGAAMRTEPAAVGVAAPATGSDQADVVLSGASANGVSSDADASDGAGHDGADGNKLSIPRKQWTFPIVDEAGALVGVVSRGDLLDAAADPSQMRQPISAFAVREAQVATPDEPVADALARLVAGGFALLPVVSGDGSKRIIGSFTRTDAVRARRVIEEQASRRERTIGQRRGAAVTGD